MNTQELNHIRMEERKYHEQYFQENSLFEKGSWLEKPEPMVLELLSRLNVEKPVRILDLGCGVGRNSIPMAQKVKAGGGQVICVDLLEEALQKLEEYSKEYKVHHIIEAIRTDIGDYSFKESTFEYIVSASSLEHAKSESVLKQVLKSMITSTKAGGINLICMNTNIEEITISSGKKREPLFEITISKDTMLNHLLDIYHGWETLHVSDRPLELEIKRNEIPVLLKADHLIFAASKPSPNGSIS